MDDDFGNFKVFMSNKVAAVYVFSVYYGLMLSAEMDLRLHSRANINLYSSIPNSVCLLFRN